MRQIRLWNSRSGERRDFTPLDPRSVRMYVCGPTVYDRAHIGNARPAVVFDVLFRLLRRAYGEGSVTYVRNITDIDDKIMARSRETGMGISEITRQTTGWFLEDMEALGNLEPTAQPRATEYVPQMVRMIGELVERGHAYEAEGHALFDVRSWERYGELAKRSVDDMIAGARVEVAPFKRHPMDFVLWKPSGEGQPGWESPWGRGRPGWHIECSAMSRELLGSDFDIHGGGADLLFPHHENELAQSLCACPDSGFARFWMHNGLIRVNGQKMAKSLGNFLTVSDLLEEASGAVLRLAILLTHYRKELDWTSERVGEAAKTLGKWSAAARPEPGAEPPPDVLDCLADDLNTPGAIAAMNELHSKGDGAGLAAAMDLLGVQALEEKPERPGNKEFAKWIEAKIQERARARESKDYGMADRIRDELAAEGVQIEDVGGETRYSLKRGAAKGGGA